MIDQFNLIYRDGPWYSSQGLLFRSSVIISPYFHQGNDSPRPIHATLFPYLELLELGWTDEVKMVEKYNFY